MSSSVKRLRWELYGMRPARLVRRAETAVGAARNSAEEAGG